jgi:hypothetical protein
MDPTALPYVRRDTLVVFVVKNVPQTVVKHATTYMEDAMMVN